MHQALKYIYGISVTVFTVALFFSCRNSYKEVQDLSISSKFPTGVAKHMKLTYTDSGVVVAILHSPEMLDFSNQKFRYKEFPKGIHLEFFDQDNNKSEVTSDYAILYNVTNLIDLQKNVVIKTHDGKLLKTDQLYWDQKSEWIFTEKSFTFESEEFDLSGKGLDSDRSFTKVNAHDIGGDIFVDEEEGIN